MQQQHLIPSYRLVRSKRRTLGISVEKGQVIIRAPMNAPKDWIDSFVREKQGWIDKHQQHQLSKLDEVLSLTNGQELAVFDQLIKLEIIDKPSAKQARTHYDKRQSHLTLSAPNIDEEKTKKMFTTWLIRQAKAHMDPLTMEIAADISLDNEIQQIRYRRSKSQWGHCTSTGIIQYNPLIALAPTWVMRYIICHEVCHLRHCNHSKRFWNLVDSICPERYQAENWLKDNGHRISFDI